MDERSAYRARLAAEQNIYRDCLDIHRLPDIFHYWSNRYVRPKLEAFGFNSPNELFRCSLMDHCRRPDPETRRFVSIGSGNCDLEIGIAAALESAALESGSSTNFVIDCLELNPAMLERGRSAADQAGLTPRMNFVEVDLNEWTADCQYDAVIANQTLHHVLDLEHLFAQIKLCLKPHGTFVISDMIGRNGHQRWPEALEIVQEYWRKLPPSYRFHRKFESYQELYPNWDYSVESFEGIRAQDILPLLLDHFHFQLFIGFANVIDPFVDPGIGGNFDAAAAWDRGFIDEVHRRDESEIRSGRIKPTHLLAIVGNDPDIPLRCDDPLTPQFCKRDPSLVPGSVAGPGPAYEWTAWPHGTQEELETACRRLREYDERMRKQTTQLEERTRWALEREQQVQERTEWALRLEQELAALTDQAIHFQQESEKLARLLEARTAWAQQLDRELEELNKQCESRSAWALRLDEEVRELNRKFEERTRWALRLDRELEEQTARLLAANRNLEQLAWARGIDQRFHNSLAKAHRAIQWVRRRR
jgi:SAM-dependent methyltransferase